jgi:hypothetical protein
MAARSCALVVALGFAASACIVSDTTQTWYVEPNGRVTWVVDEKDVRSDCQSAEDRRREEADFWLSVQQERHGAAAGLLELSGARAKTLVLRSEVPFHVRTEGKFAGLDVIGQRLIGVVAGTGTSLIKQDADRSEWTLVMRDPAASGTTGDPSDAVAHLIGSLDTLKVVLVGGRFEDAEGFKLSDDRRVASFEATEPDTPKGEEPTVKLRLAWRVN